jgi:nucleoid DNA-binding protein
MGEEKKKKKPTLKERLERERLAKMGFSFEEINAIMNEEMVLPLIPLPFIMGQGQKGTQGKTQKEKEKEKPKKPKGGKHNRETLAKLIAERLTEGMEDRLTGKYIKPLIRDLTKEILRELVETIRAEVLAGGTVEIRGLATWRTNKGKIRVRNHIKPKKTP